MECPPITIVLPNLEVGGEERVLALIANDLVISYNAKVDFVIIFNHGPFKSMLSKNINLISFSNDKNPNFINIFQIVFRFILYLKKNKYQVHYFKLGSQQHLYNNPY